MKAIPFLLLFPFFLASGCGRKEEQKLDATKLLGSAPHASNPTKGGTFIWGRGQDSKMLDPADVTDGESVTVLTNIFDTLVTFKPGTTKLTPGLALRWTTDSTRLVWTFELREGVKFHDGTPFDAEAVVFTFMRQMDEKHPARKPENRFAYFKNNFKALEKVEAVDERTVRFTLSRPYAPFLAALALHSCSIVSPAAFQRSEDLPFARNPVGTGPFVFGEWITGVRIVLGANPDYWGGAPHVDKLIFKPVKNNHARLKEVESGGLSGMDNPALTDLAAIQGNKRLRLVSRPGINVCYLALNTLKRPFDDIRVRQALAFAIDKKRIIEASYGGVGEPAPTMCPKIMPGHKPIADRRPNATRARALLEEAGLADGFETTLTYFANPRTYLTNPSSTAIQIQQDLKAIGIKVKFNKLDWNSWLTATQNGEHEMCLAGWMADIFDPDNFLYVLLDKENAVKGSSNNLSFYRSDRVHRLLLEAQQVYRMSKRIEIYHKVQEIVFDECPVIPLVTVPDFRVLRRNVRDYTIYPAGGEYFRLVSFSKQ